MLASCLGSVFVHFCWEIWQRVPAWKEAFEKGDWTGIEADILRLTGLLATEVMAACLIWYLDRKETRQLGKKLARKEGVESQGARDVRVTLATGRQILVRTPYLLPQRSGQRDYRRLPGSKRPGVKGSYPVLERLGFINRRSLLYCQEVAQAALLCPSLDVARRLLAGRGVETKGNKIRTTCVEIGRRILRYRPLLPVSEEDHKRFHGARVVIGIDGGRIRTREAPKGGVEDLQGTMGSIAIGVNPSCLSSIPLTAKGAAGGTTFPSTTPRSAMPMESSPCSNNTLPQQELPKPKRSSLWPTVLTGYGIELRACSKTSRSIPRKSLR